MGVSPREDVKRLNSIIAHCENFCFITRDSGLQKECCDKLEAMASDCAALKSQAVVDADEDLANLLLGFECVAASLRAELEMWVLLKEEKPDGAWDKLVTAQMAATDPVRAHRGFAHNEARVQRLDDIEQLIFPPQVFFSVGLIIWYRECSICGSQYGDCDHLVGKPYWGELCHTIVKDCKIDHVALVKHPANKVCRVIKFSDEGGERNRMTWKVEQALPASSN